MAFLIETHTLISEDGSESLVISKDLLGNIVLDCRDGLGAESLVIKEEFAHQFTYALNRLA